MSIDWNRIHYGICPGCNEDTFIGHGPLCFECYTKAAKADDQ